MENPISTCSPCSSRGIQGNGNCLDSSLKFSQVNCLVLGSNFSLWKTGTNKRDHGCIPASPLIKATIQYPLGEKQSSNWHSWKTCRQSRFLFQTEIHKHQGQLLNPLFRRRLTPLTLCLYYLKHNSLFFIATHNSVPEKAGILVNLSFFGVKKGYL